MFKIVHQFRSSGQGSGDVQGLFEQQGRVGFAGGFLTSCVGCHFVKYRHAFSKFQGTVGVLHGVLHISVPKSYRCSLSCAMSLKPESQDTHPL